MKESKTVLDFITKIEKFEQVNENIAWSKKINQCVKSLNKVKLISTYKDIEEELNGDLVNRIDKFIEKSKKPEFHVALVGAIKAGKSTLINAILGEDLASSSVTPETASLTKFRGSKDYNYIKLEFYSKDEWATLWKSIEQSKSEIFMEKYNNLNADLEKDKWIDKESITIKLDNLNDLKSEIKTWTSCSFAQHYFVKEVEVGLVGLNIPNEVVYVDTPGLDDPVRYRSDITRKYIDRADAILVCISASALTGQELSTIQKVFANARYSKEKIYIVGTQTDKLGNPLEDWKKQKEEWVMQLKGKAYYSNIKLANKNIMGVSAYIENICREFIKANKNIINNEIIMLACMKYQLANPGLVFAIEDYDKLNLAKEFRNFTGYIELKNKLDNEIISKHKYFLEVELMDEYKQLKEEIVEKLEMIKNREKELLILSKNSKDNIANQRETLKKKLEESKEEEEEIKILLSNIEKFTNKRAKCLISKIEDVWKEV